MRIKLLLIVGILLTAGILFTILPLNNTVASAGEASSDGAVAAENSKNLKADEPAPYINPRIADLTPNQKKALRKAAANRVNEVFKTGIVIQSTFVTDPSGALIPHYFGPWPNYATSPLPTVNPDGTISGGMRKFVDSLPGLGSTNANNLGQYLPVAVPDTTAFPGSDYYEIALVEYREQMHSDLTPVVGAKTDPAATGGTKLRGYVQEINGIPVGDPHYLGPVIIAQKDRSVRIKFTNRLPTGIGGDLFIPVDPSVMGSGPGPNHSDGSPCDSTLDATCEYYKQNRGSVHLHGGRSPWISDGTTHQWTTPAGETTQYPKGVSVRNVPDMPDPGPGALTLFYTNNQSARLMFYHDHSYGITRLNVYAGEAAAYLIQDPVELGLIYNATTNPTGVIPEDQIPLVIQDKTFVPDNITNITNIYGEFESQLDFQDPTWNTTRWGVPGDLWYPHVYMTYQNPGDPSGVSAFGRWMYSPWFNPPFMPMNPPIVNPYYNASEPNNPMEPYWYPGVPNPSIVAEAFMDTPVVNGAAYPNLTVEPKAYRFRILNAADDRFWNLQLYKASSIVSSINVTNGGSGYTAPIVTITDSAGMGTGATAAAAVDPATGVITGITVLTVGSNYTAPVVGITDPTGSGALAAANLWDKPTEVGMVPAVGPDACSIIASTFPPGWPTDNRPGGVPDPARVGPSFIQIGNDGGFLPAPAVLPMQPVDWNMDPGTFDMGIVNKYTLFLGPAERADVIVDFSAYAGQTLILYNDAPAPVPANDPRLNYYTADPDQTDTGGAPSTLPGYGPNTRTIMQIKVRGDVPASAPYDVAALETAFASTGNMTDGTFVPGAFAKSQNDIIVPQMAYGSAYNTTFPDVFAKIQDTSLTFTPINSTASVTLPMEFPSIQDEMGEAFDKEYGRMAVLMGVELPKTAFTQTTMLYGFADPPTELVKPGVYGIQIGTMDDGTEIWKITQNGVDTHPVHWHMFEVQLINRVAWDNNIRQANINELGWKDTVQVNPLQDTIVALRPVKIGLPFDIPNSIRLLDVTRPAGVELKRAPNIFDPTGQPITLFNHLVNFGWEYAWHCHILAHEENDMMRAMPIAIAPDAPTNFKAGYVFLGNRKRVRMNWTDNSTNEINFIVQRSTNGGATWTNTIVPSATGPTKGTTVNFMDNNVATGTYIYRVYASNVVGDTAVYPAPAIGFPTITLNSATTGEVTVPVP